MAQMGIAPVHRVSFGTFGIQPRETLGMARFISGF